jgi:hypothetical protein
MAQFNFPAGVAPAVEARTRIMVPVTPLGDTGWHIIDQTCPQWVSPDGRIVPYGDVPRAVLFAPHGAPVQIEAQWYNAVFVAPGAQTVHVLPFEGSAAHL